MGVLDTCKSEEDPIKNKQIKRIYVPNHFLSNLSSQNRKQKQNQSIFISSGQDINIQMFHKELYKTVGAFALKGTTYL